MSPSIPASSLSALPWHITECVTILVRQSGTSFQYEVAPNLVMNTAGQSRQMCLVPAKLNS